MEKGFFSVFILVIINEDITAGKSFGSSRNSRRDSTILAGNLSILGKLSVWLSSSFISYVNTGLYGFLLLQAQDS